jgi:glucose/arabinose dehydrogenase
MPTVPEPDAGMADVSDAYRAELVLSGLTYPSSVEFDDAGNLYIAEAGMVYGDLAAPARIFRVTPRGALTVIAEQLNAPVTDLLWYGGSLYISHCGKISAWRDGKMVDIVTGLPSLGDHQNNQLVAGPDGKLYVGQGTVTNAGVVGLDNFMNLWLQRYPDLHDVPPQTIRLTSAAFTTVNPFMLGNAQASKTATTAPYQPFGQGTPPDRQIQGTLKSNGTILRLDPQGGSLEVFAWGLRNPFGLVWLPDGRLLASDDGYDERGSRPVANALDVVWHVKQGAWYGFPDYSGGVPLTDARFKPRVGPQPEFLLQDHPPVEKPLAVFPPHMGVAKMALCGSDAFGAKGQVFVAAVGDIRPMSGALSTKEEQASIVRHAGFQVLHLDPASGRFETFFRAKPDALGPPPFEYVATAGPKRPVDVLFSPDGGTLYIADLGVLFVTTTAVPMPIPRERTGAIWRVTRQGAKPFGPPAGMKLQPTAKAPGTP